MSAEQARLRGGEDPMGRLLESGGWDQWGPWLAERAWGSVREDYSADGDAWNAFPHDHARSRAYRWNEDGLAGLCDNDQRLCFAVALWNGRDPILKERAFGLAGPEGNHGEDVKEYWWYLDAVPSSAYLRWRYHYPQRAFPYADLVATNARRTRHEPEYELLDTGAFDDDRYWIVEVTYAKEEPQDVLIELSIRNAGPDPDTIHVLPTLWFRNTWSWEPGAPRPRLWADDGAVVADHGELGRYRLLTGPGPDGAPPKLVFCENDTNVARLYGAAPTTAYPKDGINDHVVSGAPTVDPAATGTKAAAWYQLTIGPGETRHLRLRLRAASLPELAVEPFGDAFTDVMALRRSEADEFYAEVPQEPLTGEDAAIMRQAFAGMLWSCQYYHYNVERWLSGDPTEPPPPPGHAHVRNGNWTNLDASDVITMPDPWEYPWFATWDLAFHTVVLAHVDPTFAKHQLLLMLREWYQHPNGALPAYEWDFSDTNPPVHAWAALRVFALDGGRDHAFLARAFHKLLLNFTWWVNRKDPEGNNVFEGGFLGLDNISPIDRSELPVDGILEQPDATAWMALFCLDLFRIAGTLATRQPEYQDVALKFFEHFGLIARSLNRSGLWDESGFFYDRLVTPTGSAHDIPVRSMVGALPVVASADLPVSLGQRLPVLAHHVRRFVAKNPDVTAFTGIRGQPGQQRMLLTLASEGQLRRILGALFDEDEFLSPYGLRSLSKRHLAHPVTVDVEGVRASIDYEPAESTTAMFGGNSNWRGPVWFPVNYLLIESLLRYHSFYGDSFTVEYPTGSGRRVTLRHAASDIASRLVGLFRRDGDGRRPAFGGVDRMQTDPEWRDHLLFHEYFHGDDGSGLGASHQTGWTGLVAHLLAGTKLLGDDRQTTERHTLGRAVPSPTHGPTP